MENILDLGYSIIRNKKVPDFKNRADKFKKGLAITIATFDTLHIVEKPNENDKAEYEDCRKDAIIGLRILQDMFPMLEYFNTIYTEKIKLDKMSENDFKILYDTLVSLETLLRNLYNTEIKKEK